MPAPLRQLCDWPYGHACNPTRRLVGLPPSTSREQLLGSEASSTGVSTAKKGAMKGGATGSTGSRIGFPRTLSARHLADGGTLPLEMQVGGSNRAAPNCMPLSLCRA